MSRRTIHVSILSLLVGVSCAEVPDTDRAGEGPEALQPVDPIHLMPLISPGETAPIALTAAQTQLPKDAWVAQPGGTNNDKVWSVAAAPNGDVYAVGYTHSSTFAGQSNIGGASGTADAFLVRYDVAKNLRSVTLFGTTAHDYAMGIAVCPDGSAYVAGYTYGSLPNAGAQSAGDADLFVTKFEASGAQRWTRQMGTSSADKALALAVDCSRASVYVVGETKGSLGGQPGAGVEDAFLTKLQDNGASVGLSFTKLLGTAKRDQAHAVAVDADGDVHVAGATYGSLGAIANPDATGNTADLFVARYDANGALQAIDQRGTSADDVAKGIGVTRVDGAKRVYVVGYTGGALNGQVSKGGFDAILLQYAAADAPKSLVLSSTKQDGGAGNELASAVALAPDGLIYVTGSTSSDLSTGALNSPWSSDVFLAKFDRDGALQSVLTQLDSISNPQDASRIHEEGLGVASDGDSNVYVGGYTQWQLGGAANQGGDDALVVRVADGCTLNTARAGCSTGHSWGDPHLKSFDGSNYDYQGAGDFVTVQQTQGNPLLIQARQCALNTRVSVNKAIAAKVGAQTIVFQPGSTSPTLVPASGPTESVSLAVGASRVFNGGALQRRPATGGSAAEYVVRWWSGERLRIIAYGGSITYYVHLPEARKSGVQGLLGDYDGITSSNDDFNYTSSARVTGSSLFDPVLPSGVCTNLAFPAPYQDPAGSLYYCEAYNACTICGSDKINACILDYVELAESGNYALSAVSTCADVTNSPYTLTWLSGVADGYATANGVESPTPSNGVKQWVQGWYGQNPTISSYDLPDHSYDQVWAHTFAGLAPPSDRTLCKGKLTLRVHSRGSNDGLGLPFVDANGTAMGTFFYRYLSHLGVPYGADGTIVLDLGNLQSANGAMNVLPTIATRGYLDMYVQDDSRVDFAELTLEYCAKQPVNQVAPMDCELL